MRDTNPKHHSTQLLIGNTSFILHGPPMLSPISEYGDRYVIIYDSYFYFHDQHPVVEKSQSNPTNLQLYEREK